MPKIIIICLWQWAQGHKVSIPWNDGLTFRHMLNKIHQDIPPSKGLVLANKKKSIFKQDTAVCQGLKGQRGSAIHERISQR